MVGMNNSVRTYIFVLYFFFQGVIPYFRGVGYPCSQ